MKEISKYKCEICGIEYAERLKCEKCESGHKLKAKIKSTHYLPITVDGTGYPNEVEIVFADGSVKKYKRARGGK